MQVRAEHLDSPRHRRAGAATLVGASGRSPASSSPTRWRSTGRPCASRGMRTCWCRGPARRWARASGARSVSASRPRPGWASGPRRWSSRPACSTRTTGRQPGCRAPRAGRGGHRPAYRLRGEVTVDEPAVRARLLRDRARDLRALPRRERVGTDELTPGYTEYAARTQVQTYDVTALLDARAATWSRRCSPTAGTAARSACSTPTTSGAPRRRSSRSSHLEHEDGTTTVVGTDESWRWATSHITETDLIEGQHEDRRLGGLAPATTPSGGTGRGERARVRRPRLLAAPPVRPVEELRPVSVTSVREGVFVVDLGQNINGRVRLTSLGPPAPGSR